MAMAVIDLGVVLLTTADRLVAVTAHRAAALVVASRGIQAFIMVTAASLLCQIFNQTTTVSINYRDVASTQPWQIIRLHSIIYYYSFIYILLLLYYRRDSTSRVYIYKVQTMSNKSVRRTSAQPATVG